MEKYIFTWTEEWNAVVEAENEEHANELLDNLDRDKMGFCGSDNYQLMTLKDWEELNEEKSDREIPKA